MLKSLEIHFTLLILITLCVGVTLANTGSITSSGALSIAANAFTNQMLTGTSTTQAAGVRYTPAAKSTAIGLDNTGLITAASDIMIAANDNITNSGTISAGGTLVLQAADILNQEAIAQGAKIMTRHSGWSGTYAQVGVGGGVLSGNSVVAVAENSITNAAGQIISGAGGTTLLAGSKVNADGSVTYLNNGGTITNTSLKLVDGSGYYMNGFHYDNAAMVSGGNTTLVASNMIIQQGSMIAAQGDITLLAQNGISTDASTGKVELGKRYWSPLMEASSVTSATGSVDGKAELGDITVKGTALAAANDIALTAGQNIDIDAAIQSYTQKTKSSGFSGLSYSSTTTKSQLNAVQISSLEAGNDITLNAGNDLTMKGALLNAGNDIALKAVGDVTVTQQQVTNSVKTSGFSVALNASAGGALGLVANSNNFNTLASGGDMNDVLSNAVDKSPLLGTLKGLSQMQGPLDLANAMKLGMMGADYANNKTTMDGLLTGGDSTKDPMSLASGASVGVRFGTSKSSSTWTDSYRSGLNAGGDIRVVSGGDVNLTGGTSLNAGNNISLAAAGALNIAAGADTNSSKSSSSGVSVGVSSGGITVGLDGSKASSNGTTYTNATLDAGNTLSLSSGADTNITGANLKAEHVIVNVGGDLNLASVQNTSSSKNSSFSVSASQSGAVSGSGAEGNSNRVFTDNQTSIIGSESVDITVKNNTDIKGAVIANVDENGVDQGNLTLTTATLTTSDLMDSDKSKQVSVGLGVAGSGGVDANGNQVGSGFSANTGTGSYDSTNTQGVSKATIGSGEIVTGSDISGINRDVKTAQVIISQDDTHISVAVPLPDAVSKPISEGGAVVANATVDAGKAAGKAVVTGVAAIKDQAVQIGNSISNILDHKPQNAMQADLMKLADNSGLSYSDRQTALEAISDPANYHETSCGGSASLLGLFISEAYAGSPCVKFSATKTGNQALDNLIVDMGTLCLTASQKADTLGNGIGTGLQYVDAGLTTALGAPYTVGKDRLGDAAYVIGLGTQAGINNIDGLIEETTGNTNVIGGTLTSLYDGYTDNTTPGQRTLINTILTVAPFAVGKFGVGVAGEAGIMGETAATRLNLSLISKPTTIDNIDLSTIARNDGNLGEQLAQQTLNAQTGLDFKPIQNGSGNGADLVAVDHNTQTIWVQEVKTSTVGSFPNAEGLDLYNRSDRWLTESANFGTIFNKPLDSATANFADEIQQLRTQGYITQPGVVQVGIPKNGTTGTASIMIVPLKPAP